MASPTGEWLTWQGIRDLADCEAQADGSGVRYVRPWRKRAVSLSNGRLQSVVKAVSVVPGSVVYARDCWRHPWREALAQSPPCTLVTTFNDAHVQAHAAEALLDGTEIRRWFAVQCATTHPKLTAMPLGVDRRDLPTLHRAPRAERDVLLYLNFQPRNDERRALLSDFGRHSWVKTDLWRTTIASSAVGYGPSMSPAAYYANLGRSRFVLSPPGRGWDCYRTYEAVLMGAIPIVRRQPPLSEVVTELPVLVVDDWSEVTEARLRTFQPPAWTLESLRLDFWTERIRHGADSQSTDVVRG